MKERKLIERAVRGDKDAFCELYGLYRERLYRYAFYKLRDPHMAEDVVSECVLSVWQEIRNLRSADAFSVWIFRILSAHCAKQMKKLIQERENLEELFRKSEQTVPDSSLSLELAEALDQLNPEEREIVLLSAAAGMKSREIAVFYGMTAGSVRSKLSRSFSRMRKFLEVKS